MMINRTRAIALGGLFAGTCDILYAILYSYFRSGVPPMRILQSVASGLLGKAAYDGGVTTALAGLGLHFFIALCAAAFYGLAARSVPVLVRRAFVCGAFYGFGIYLFMNFVVIPLSRVPPRTAPPALLTVVTGIIVHMFLVGVPIALAVRRAEGAGATA
jgi:uncharacterized membrane protein YagU involved in acid resistance